VLRSLFSGVSGMDANQEWIDTIGNDIANINTTGYKSNEVQFEDLLSQTIAGATAPTTTVGGVDPTQVGLGVKVAGIEANFTQGTSEQTGNPLDLSVQGDGFLVAKGSGQTYYTRAGSLKLDANGDLVTPDGYLIQGWAANSSGVINTNAPLSNVVIPTGQQLAANATQNVTLGGNLNSQTGWTPPKGFGSGTGTPPPGTSTSVTVYAPNGSTESLDMSFSQASTVSGGPTTGTKAAYEWTMAGVLTDPGATPDYTSAPTYNLYFDASGNFLGYAPSGGSFTAGTAVPIKVNDETGGQAAGTASANFTLDVPTVTANASADTLSVLSQDGNAPGTLQSYSIGSNGIIQGVFSNGQTLDLGQIALANFANPDGLARSGDTNFMSTANSGLAQVGQANNGSFGSIQAGTLEASNVDLATEMTQLIAAQNGFQANGSVISTANTLLQTLIQLKP
jgi:flagellar hook protein FlgE